MKYPILTKLISIGLCICCLALLVSGIYGIDKAGEDRTEELIKLSETEKNAEDYRSLNLALEGEISYKEARKELEEREKAYREAASEHRQELTEYSATKGGLTMGSEAMDEAELAMQEMEGYYEQGKAQLDAMEEYLPQLKAALEQGRAQYEAGAALYELGTYAVENIRSFLDELYSLDEMMDSDDGSGRVELSLAAYDSAIYAFENTMDFVWQLEKEGIITAEQIMAVENQIMAATGMYSGDILNLLYNNRDAVASGTQDGITEEEFQAIKDMYNLNREMLMSAAASIETVLIEADWQLQLIGSQMETAAQQLAQGEDMLNMALASMPQGRLMLEEMKKAMDEGGEALINARNEMAAKFGELDEQLKELKAEKERLSTDSEEIEALKKENDERRELEGKRTSLSLTLRDTDEIKALYEDGTELYEAAEIYAGKKALSIEEAYNDSIAASVSMIVSAAAGIMSLFIIFSKKNPGCGKRVALPLASLALALGAEGISYFNSLGHIYSALTVSVIAALTILAAIPSKKKKTNSV